jgi:hypothetical protein
VTASVTVASSDCGLFCFALDDILPAAFASAPII